MDDLDELLGSLQPSTDPETAVQTTAAAPASGFSIEDDFDALLDSMTVPDETTHTNHDAAPQQQGTEPAVSGDASESATTSQWTSLQDKEQQDFMAWLDGEDDKPAVRLTTELNLVETKEELRDNQPEMVVHSPNQSMVAKIPTSKDLSTLLESSFVDVEALRTICLQLGSIPMSLRAQVWSYLLSGQSQPDVQVDLWRYDSSKIQNAAAMEADCEAAAQSTLEKFKGHEDFSLMTNLANDLKDVISLYCVRKSLPYHPTYLSTLLPLLVPPCSMSRPQASLCLYALCSHLFPLIGLTPDASSLGLQKFHSWMRLLLNYHFPALVQHFDRVLPNWESAACDSLTNVSLPEESLTASDGTSAASDNTSPGSSSGKLADGLPSVPLAWTCGFFAGCLPSAEQTHLWDWGIVQGNKYASLYLTVALFGMFSEALLQLTGAELSGWMAAISAGQPNWHRLYPLHNSDTCRDDLSMQQFVKAWIAGASWMRGHTPNSFQEAMEGLEGWAVHAAAQLKSSTADTQRPAGVKEESKDAEAGLNTLFQAFSKLSTFAVANAASSTQDGDSPPPSLQAPPQGMISQPSSTSTSPSMQPRSNARMCLWTTAQDVVAQLCISNIRSKTGASQQTFVEEIADRLSNPKDEYPSCEPINRLTTKVNATNMSRPQAAIRYFGIDCRPSSLLRYGRFATAYHFDPVGLDEPEAIATMLETLEPLRSSVHFCLIGSGEALIRQECGNNTNQLQRALTDATAQLNAMAMFLLKQHFPFVSVLQGGFSAAATFIAQGKAPRGLDTLVDANLPALGRAIGIPISSNEQSRNSPQPMDSLRDMFRLPPTTVNTTEILDDIGEKFKNTFASLKKLSASSFAAPTTLRPEAQAAAQQQPQAQRGSTQGSAAPPSSNPSPTFVIGGDDDDEFLDDSEQTPESPSTHSDLQQQDSTSISVSKTDAEKRFALAQHRLSGLQKSDTIEITKENFPGSILFPSIKYKYVDEKEEEAIQAHRFLVVTPERLIVLDSGGGGVGSIARVKSNHHLTELLKMTFRKKDPDFVSIYYARGPGEPPRVNRYRISKKQEFVEVLQRNTAKFR